MVVSWIVAIVGIVVVFKVLVFSDGLVVPLV